MAVVTGASEGIGRGIAVKLAENSYVSVLAARNREGLQKTGDVISNAGGQSIIIPTDVTEEDDVVRLFRKADSYGRLDLLVNNAGVASFKPVEEISLDEWLEMIQVNLTGAFLCCREAVTRMKKRRKGHIVFMNSFSGKRPLPHGGGYSAAKYGLRGLADTLRLEVRKFNIKVTSVYPGSVDSSWWDKFDYDFPRKQMISVESVVDAVWGAISQTGRSVVEEIFVRQVGGDF
ncbi:MAG: SDR family oxidoreductase [Candidatus Neomarinimicrobiota bacterium]